MKIFKFLILFLLLFATSASAAGTTYTVQTSGGLYNQIEDAMNAASANANPPDTVLVYPGTYNMPNTVAYKSGVVLISLSGKDYTFINAPANSRHFRFHRNGSGIAAYTYGQYTKIGLTNQGFTFQNGAPSDSSGGSVRIGISTGAGQMTSGIIKFTDCVFKNNTSASNSGKTYASYGAAMSAYMSNSATDSLCIRDCRFTENVLTTDGTQTPIGGGLYMYQGGINSVIDGCEFDHTTTSTTTGAAYGGGLCLQGFTGRFTNNTIHDNFSNNTSTGVTLAGGIYLNTSSFTITEFSDNTFYSNNAAQGAAMYVTGSNSTILNNLIVHNNTNLGVRAPVFIQTGKCNITNSLFYGNSGASGSNASAIYIQGTTTAADDCILQNCTVANNTGTMPQVAYANASNIASHLVLDHTLVTHAQSSASKNVGLGATLSGATIEVNCSIIWRSGGANLPGSANLVSFTDSDTSNAAGYNPDYCNASTGDYTVRGSSKANNGIAACGQIGWGACGCGNCSGIPDPTGRCCHYDGTCSIETEAACLALTPSGIYGGDNTICGTISCIDYAEGACCKSDLTCAVMDSTDCLTGGGTYLGYSIPCSPTPCDFLLPHTYTVCTDGTCDFETIDDALTSVTPDSTPANNIVVHPGTYTLSSEITFPSGVGLYSSDGADSTKVYAASGKRHFKFPPQGVAGVYDKDTFIGLPGKGFTFIGGAPADSGGGSIRIGSATTSVSKKFQGVLKITDCVFRENTSPTGTNFNGGAISAICRGASTDSLVIRDCSFIKNTITTGSTPLGGAVYIHGGGIHSVFENCVIDTTYLSTTSAAANGAGFAGDSLKLSFNNNTISNCPVSSSNGNSLGGGIYIGNNSTAITEFLDNTVHHCTAGRGSAIYFVSTNTNPTVIDGLIAHHNTNTGNTAPVYFITGRGLLKDCLIYSNKAVGGNASGVYISGSSGTGVSDSTKIEGCTIAGNIGSASIAQVAYSNAASTKGPFLIKNSIISHPYGSVSGTVTPNIATKNVDFAAVPTNSPIIRVKCSILWRTSGTNIKGSGITSYSDSDTSNSATYDPSYCDFVGENFHVDNDSKANSGIASCGQIGWGSCGCGNCDNDFTAPAAISTLAFSDSTLTSLTISWTSPGDDNSTGTATSYDIRYSTQPITSANFDQAIKVSNPPTPSLAGTIQTYTFENLSSNTRYWVAMKTSDEVPNTSSISNIINQTVVINVDPNNPGAVDLTIVEIYPTGVKIAFHATGDDGSEGIASYYDVRTASSSTLGGQIFTESNFVLGTFFPGTPEPSAPGTLETFTVWGLSPSVYYEIGVKVYDELGNSSLLSRAAFSTTAETTDMRKKLYEMTLNYSRPRLFYNDALDAVIKSELGTARDGRGQKKDLLWSLMDRSVATKNLPHYVLVDGVYRRQEVGGGRLLGEVIHGLVYDDDTYLSDAKNRIMEYARDRIWNSLGGTAIGNSFNYSDDGDIWLYAVAYDWIKSVPGIITTAERDSLADWIRTKTDTSILINPTNRKGVFYNHETGEACIQAVIGVAFWDSTLSDANKIAIEKLVRCGDNRMRGVRNLADGGTPGSNNNWGGALDSKQKFMHDGGYYKGIQYGGKDLYYAVYYLELMKENGFGDYFYNYTYLDKIPEYMLWNLRPDGFATKITSGAQPRTDTRWLEALAFLANHWADNSYYQEQSDLANFYLNEEWFTYNTSSPSDAWAILGANWRPTTPSVEDPPTTYLPKYKYYGPDSVNTSSFASKLYVRDDWRINSGRTNPDDTNNSHDPSSGRLWNSNINNNFYLRFDANSNFGDYRNFHELSLEIYNKGSLLSRNGWYEKSPYSQSHYNMASSCSVPVILDTTIVSVFNSGNSSGYALQTRGDWWGTDFLYVNPGVPEDLDDVTSSSTNEYNIADMDFFRALDNPNTSSSITKAFNAQGHLNRSSAYYYSNTYRDMKKVEREIFNYGHYVVVRDSMRIGSASSGELLKILHQGINEHHMRTSNSSNQFIKVYFRLFRKTDGVDNVWGNSDDGCELLTNSNSHCTAISASSPADSVAGEYNATTGVTSFKFTANAHDDYQIWETIGTDTLAAVQMGLAAEGTKATSVWPFGQFKNTIPIYSRGRFDETNSNQYLDPQNTGFAFRPNNKVSNNGKLIVDPLLPTNLTLRRVSKFPFAGWKDDGRGNGNNTFYSLNNSIDTTAFHSYIEVGQSRVESTAQGGTTATEFLHVYFAGSASGTYADTTMQGCKAIQVSTSGGTHLCTGVEVDSTFIWVRSFTNAIDDASRLVFYFDGSVDGSTQETLPVFVTNLLSGSQYSVRKKSADPANADHYTANGDGSLTFMLSGSADSVYVYKYIPTEPVLGACCISTDCTITGESGCAGTWLGPNTICSPNPCVPYGACCFEDGSCELVQQVDCLGTYSGDDTVCSPNPCTAATGACCVGASCSIKTINNCSGTWFGSGTTCTPDPCGGNSGACCLDDGTCTVKKSSACGGTYQGNGTTCSPNPCTQPTGSCCTNNGTCTELTNASCSGIWGGYGSDCSPNPCTPAGACCLGDGNCVVIAQSNCETYLGRTYMGDGSVCNPNPCDLPSPGQNNDCYNAKGSGRTVGTQRSGIGSTIH